jgi:Ca2+-binding EF-hand superfamily protein
LACITFAGRAIAADGAGPTPQKSTAATTAVLFAPEHPVFLRLRITVDGLTLDRFRERAIRQWFRQLDRNRDGFLDKTEIVDFLKAVAEQMESGPRPAWESADRDPADGKVSPREFHAFVERQLGPPLALALRKETTSEVDLSLFHHLDVNGDGLLTLDELRHAKESLAPLDADDDETISTAELMAAAKEAPRQNRETADERNGRAPARKTRATGAAPSQGESPPPRLALMLLGPGTPSEVVAQALVREYGQASGAPERRVSLAALGLSSQVLDRAPVERGATLGIAELARFVVEIPPQAELSFQLFDQQHGRPQVAVVPLEHPPALQWRAVADENGLLVVNGLKLELSAKRTRGATGDRRSFYALRFNIVDRDRNNYLDKREFAELGLPDADFGAVDTDRDNQITQAELSEFLRRTSNVFVNQVVLSVSDESPSLFEFLDTRADGRLSPRELNAAAARLAALDRNRDGNLTLGELRTQIRLEAEVKRPADPRPVLRVVSPQKESSAPLSPDSGPEWFRRMDRNYDGDVSWREFLGPRTLFDRLDTDHDGLLSPEEAEHAK